MKTIFGFYFNLGLSYFLRDGGKWKTRKEKHSFRKMEFSACKMLLIFQWKKLSRQAWQGLANMVDEKHKIDVIQFKKDGKLWKLEKSGKMKMKNTGLLKISKASALKKVKQRL